MNEKSSALPFAALPPDGKDYPRLTYMFANGVRSYHGGGWGGILSFRGTEGEIPARGAKESEKQTPPDIHIPTQVILGIEAIAYLDSQFPRHPSTANYSCQDLLHRFQDKRLTSQQGIAA